MHQHAAELQQQQAAAAGLGGGSEGGEARPQDVQQAAGAQQQQQGEMAPAAGQPGPPRPRVKVVANLPYYITKDCLVQASAGYTVYCCRSGRARALVWRGGGSAS